jgi:tRNA pseudouridine32 synthase/23S rRNA pseudouridine746 synthase
VPAARLHLPQDGAWPTVAAFLLERTRHAAGVAERLVAGEVRWGDGTAVAPDTRYAPGQWVYLYRDLPDEAPVPGEITVLYADSDIVVVDKPHFLATMPRGRHVAQTVVVRLRRELGLPELAPAHRLDRLTAGVLLLTVRREVRGAYQELFARREVRKTYHALAPVDEALALPATIRSRIVKHRGVLQAAEVPGDPNAITGVELLERRPARSGPVGRYRLTPETGRTHQIRVHLAGLGIPILNDPLYPTVVDRAPDDFSRPLQLLATSLAFTDPLTGEPRDFRSLRTLSPGGSAADR